RRDRVLRDVGAPGLDVALAQLLDEDAERAARVEGDLRVPAGDDLVGDVAEEAGPVPAAVVRAAFVVAVVAGVVEPLRRGCVRPLLARWRSANHAVTFGHCVLR